MTRPRSVGSSIRRSGTPTPAQLERRSSVAGGRHGGGGAVGGSRSCPTRTSSRCSPDLTCRRTSGRFTYAGDRRPVRLRSCALLVTDYSSVAFNVAYLDGPVVYYQFDRARDARRSTSRTAGYFDYERDGFGPVVIERADAESAIVAAIDRGPHPSPEYQARIDRTFPNRDGDSCARVVAAIEEMSRPYVEGRRGSTAAVSHGATGRPGPIVSVVSPPTTPGRTCGPCIRLDRRAAMPRREGRGDLRRRRLDGRHPGSCWTGSRSASRTCGSSTVPGLRRAGRARNVGIAAARGEFVVLLDADDELERTSLERMTAMAIAEHVGQSSSVASSAPSTTFQQRLFERSIERCTLAIRAQARRGPAARRPAVPPRVPRREPAGLQGGLAEERGPGVHA